MKKVALLLAVSAAVCLLASGCSTAAQTSAPPAPAPAASMAASAPAASATSSGSMMGSGADSATPITVTGTALVGQKIFLEGMTPSGPVKFTGGSDDVGNGACANCHGKNAGGGDGPMVSWSMLTMKDPAMGNMPKFSYTSPDQVVVAMVTGTRPDGTKLKTNMPRYQLSSAEAAAVVDYLKALK